MTSERPGREGRAARKALEKLGLDKALHESDAGQYVERMSAGAKHSNGVGRAIFWLVAGRLLDEAYRKGQEERGRIRRDMEVGKERAKDRAQRAKPGLADGRGAGATAMH